MLNVTKDAIWGLVIHDDYLTFGVTVNLNLRRKIKWFRG